MQFFFFAQNVWINNYYYSIPDWSPRSLHVLFLLPTIHIYSTARVYGSCAGAQATLFRMKLGGRTANANNISALLRTKHVNNLPSGKSPSWICAWVPLRSKSSMVTSHKPTTVRFFTCSTCFYYIFFLPFSIFLFVSILRHLANHNGVLRLCLCHFITPWIRWNVCASSTNPRKSFMLNTQDTLVSNAREWHAPFSIELSSVSRTVIIYRHASTYGYSFGAHYRDQDDNNDGKRTSALV